MKNDEKDIALGTEILKDICNEISGNKQSENDRMLDEILDDVMERVFSGHTFSGNTHNFSYKEMEAEWKKWCDEELGDNNE